MLLLDPGHLEENKLITTLIENKIRQHFCHKHKLTTTGKGSAQYISLKPSNPVDLSGNSQTFSLVSFKGDF